MPEKYETRGQTGNAAKTAMVLYPRAHFPVFGDALFGKRRLPPKRPPAFKTGYMVSAPCTRLCLWNCQETVMPPSSRRVLHPLARFPVFAATHFWQTSSILQNAPRSKPSAWFLHMHPALSVGLSGNCDAAKSTTGLYPPRPFPRFRRGAFWQTPFSPEKSPAFKTGYMVSAPCTRLCLWNCQETVMPPSATMIAPLR